VVKPDRSRYIWLYCKSKAQKDEWQALAEKADTPLSAWCASIIEERIAEDGEHRPRHKLAKELEALKADNKALRDDLRQKEVVLQRYEAELRRYRAEPFQADAFKGVRTFSKELVDILKARGHVGSYQILELLGINPGEAEAIKAVSKQLEELEKFNLIKADGKGWQWIA
jgi:septal ring factor EnvC (AmiA/AmiB activator)